MMDHCESCGRALRADARYCPGCGTPATSPPSTRVAPPPYDERYAAPSYDERPARPPTDLGSRRGVVPALVAAMAVLLVAVGVGVFLLVRSPAEAEPQAAVPYLSPQSAPGYPAPEETGGASVAPSSAPASPAASAA